MGVTGLWTVVQPCARPIKLETLNKKRLAVDASIWIYQFLKAVRDKEGNALRNSHVVGFFRRICKLLFVGIQPVFVFDGGAPALKRQTIRARKSRREGRKEDAVRTAGKLLALQMQRAAEDEEEKRRRERDEARRREEEEEVVDEGKLVYVDELQMTQQERQQNRRFRKKDQYHLPELDASLAEMGAPNDPRIMSLEELEAYARQFDTGEDINVYDFSKIDFDSPFFTSLPASDRYNILNAARLRSRLRMGYSKDQLDTMFPNRMDFSRFQIERVTERNELTQRLMNINGMNDDMMWGINGTGRVAGEKGREYVLVKNDGVEGGWALGVVSGRDEGEKEKPIDVDELGERARQQDEEEEQSEEDFEDVPIEGLNRLPKQTSGAANAAQQEISRQRRALYAKRRSAKSRSSRPKRTRPVTQPDDPESLFVADEEAAESSEEEAIEDNGEMDVEEDEELNRAIAMSLQREDEEGAEPAEEEDKDDNYLGVFQQKRVEEAPNFKGTAGSSGLAIARQVNARANKAPKSTVFQAESDSEDEKQDQPNGSQSPRRGKASDKTKPSADQQRASRIQASVTEASRPKPKSNGPLPFEKLDLGNSLFGKKLEKIEEKNAGGFEKAGEKKDEARPLPPWFAGNIEEDIAQQNAIEKADREQAKKYKEDQQFQFDEPSVLRRQETGEVIDLEAEESQDQPKQVLIIDDEDEEPDQTEKVSGEAEKPEDEEDEDVTMGDMADDAKINPPVAEPPTQSALPPVIHDPAVEKPPEDRRLALQAVEGGKEGAKAAESDEETEWSASEDESKPVSKAIDTATTANPSSPARAVPSRSASPDFEDVQIPAQPDPVSERANVLSTQIDQQTAAKDHTSGLADQNAPAEDEEDYGLATDSEDEDLMRQLEIEAQEHARFASELNQKSQQQNIAEYERELKQLRTQQKKDRRDADEVTQIMITECQQLLRLFGLPYITAPMEAEAQCAELVHLGLVDGIVTDDSDCFLFGGTRIYKNMFNQAKFVECYVLSDLEKEFDLTRKKLIGIAHLLGSDYTEGVPGIGPVSALEILSEFQDLEKFRDWWSGVQEGRVKKEEDMGFAFRRKFRKNATKLFLPHVFPDPRVEMAYLQPEVDSDPSEFQWGVPDLDALRSFLMATIGWSQERTDEVLVPVIRDMNRRQEEGTQSNITKFFAGGTGAGAYAPRVRAAETSKRLGGALGRMAERAQRKRAGKNGEVEEVGGDAGDEVEPAVSAAVEDANGAARPKKSRKRKSAAANEENDEGADFAEEQSKGRKKRKAPSRRKKAAADDSDD